MSEKIICGIGEILWDQFPDMKRPGGAPSNVIYHTTQLGFKSRLISRVGDDKNGLELVHYLNQKGVSTEFIQLDNRYETGRVEVTFDEKKEPHYNIIKPAAWDYIEKNDWLKEIAKTADAIVFGTLAQRMPKSAETIQWFLKQSSVDTLKVLDVNFRSPYVYEDIVKRSLYLADVVKINHEEQTSLREMLKVSDLESVLLNEFNITGICITKGLDGSEWVSKELQLNQPVYKAKTGDGDSVGLGDGFTAVLTAELVKHGDAAVAMDRASRYTAMLAGRRGGMPELSQKEIEQVFNK